MTLVISNDVEQKYKNRCIFHTLWKRREPTETDMQVQGYSFKQIMQLAKAAMLPIGKSYETVTDLINHVMRVTIDYEDYNGKTNERVKYMNSSKFPENKHIYKKKTAVSADTVAPQKQEQFAGSAGLGSLDDFEEILGDGDVPF